MCLMTLLFSWQACGADSVPPVLNCMTGPLTKTFGSTDWLVYSCDNNRTVIFVTAPGSRASPFYFRLSPDKDGYHLTGEGTGNQEATDAAYEDLSKLSEQDIAALIAEARKH